MGQLLTDMRAEGASRRVDIVRLWLRLFSCERSIKQRLRSHLRVNFGVTLPQFEVLCELDRSHAPIVMSLLSERLGVTSSNITGVVDRLERNGLVKRFSSRKDRRIRRIKMTSAGQSTFAEIAADKELWVTGVFTELTDKDVIQLEKLLLEGKSVSQQSADLKADI